MDRRASRLAAVIYERDDDVDAILRSFVAVARREGARVCGFVQEIVGEEHDVRLRDVETGAEIAIMQDLGAGATGCRLDSAAIAVAAERIGRVLTEAPDLLVVNRFGKLESEGGGLLAELGEAVALDVPVVVCVPRRFRDAWNAFAAGLDAQLPPDRAEIEAWWALVTRAYA